MERIFDRLMDRYGEDRMRRVFLGMMIGGTTLQVIGVVGLMIYRS